jgi:hypothetical protein
VIGKIVVELHLAIDILNLSSIASRIAIDIQTLFQITIAQRFIDIQNVFLIILLTK